MPLSTFSAIKWIAYISTPVCMYRWAGDARRHTMRLWTEGRLGGRAAPAEDHAPAQGPACSVLLSVCLTRLRHGVGPCCCWGAFCVGPSAARRARGAPGHAGRSFQNQMLSIDYAVPVIAYSPISDNINNRRRSNARGSRARRRSRRTVAVFPIFGIYYRYHIPVYEPSSLF